MRFEPDKITEEKIEKMRHIFPGYPQVQAAYLFGSQLTGKNLHQESDIDIGVFVDKYVFDLKVKLLSELSGLFNRIDLVMMEIADIPDFLLAYEIVKENKPFFYRENFNYVNFATQIIMRYLDMKPLLEFQFQALKEKVLHG